MTTEKIDVNDPCVCCGGSGSSLHLRTRFVGYPGAFDYRRCNGCGLVFNSPRLRDQDSLYDEDYFLFHRAESYMRGRVLQQIQELALPAAALAPGRRIVEVGAARGHLLAALATTGFEVQGIEISEAAVDYARQKYDLPIFNGTVEAYLAESPAEAFDLAISCTVLEHVDDPQRFVADCARLLKPGGILVMDMPNMNANRAVVYGEAWDMYQKYHIFMYDPKTIRGLLESNGFRVERTYTHGNAEPTADRVRRARRNRRVLQVLERLGLYRTFRSVFRSWMKRSDGGTSGDFRPITAAEVEALEPYDQSPDARAPLADAQEGEHLVVIARKV